MLNNGKEEREAFISRLNDYRKQYHNHKNSICSNFLTPWQQEFARSFYGNKEDIFFIPESEGIQKCLSFQDKDGIVLYKGEFSKTFDRLSQKDVYGALMQLGLDKDKFGDIWMEDNTFYFYVKREISSYIEANFTQVHRYHFKLTKQNENRNVAFNYLYFSINVTSNRLDAFVSAIGKMSRSKAQQLIKMGYVSLNFNSIVETTDLCNNNDIISIRKVGRFKVIKQTKVSRKDHLIYEIAKFN